MERMNKEGLHAKMSHCPPWSLSGAVKVCFFLIYNIFYSSPRNLSLKLLLQLRSLIIPTHTLSAPSQIKLFNRIWSFIFSHPSLYIGGNSFHNHTTDTAAPEQSLGILPFLRVVLRSLFSVVSIFLFLFPPFIIFPPL